MAMEGKILCATEHLIVRRFVQADLEELYRILSDPKVMACLEPPYTHEKTEQFLREAALVEQPLVYAVDDKRGQFLGYVICHGYDTDSVELGWVLKPSVWGRGYASELTRALLTEMEGQYTSAVIECVPQQGATKAIAQKNGFHYMGTGDGCEIYRKELGCRPLLHRKELKMELIKLREHPGVAEKAARWFHEKWGIPLEAYQESMTDCLKGTCPVPQWYLALEGERIVGGLGVIENDFHDRKDLTPNVCAVYVEEDCRCQGIAGGLLKLVCRDMEELGICTLYLLTDHDSFYERYGWEFFCLAQGDGEETPSRMYIHENKR